MPKYRSWDANIEVRGSYVHGFLENTRRAYIMPALRVHHLDTIDPDHWYPLQDWLDVLTTISKGYDPIFSFVSIGIAMLETATLAPETEQMSLGEFLKGLNDFYQSQHRGGNVGAMGMTALSARHIIVETCVPYPDDLEYGIVYGAAKRFLPRGTHVIVHYDDDLQRRDLGGDITVLHIEW